MKINRVLLSSCIAVLALAVPVIPAHAGWFDFLFPPAPSGPSPSETLRAPFADEDAVIEELDSEGNVESTSPLDIRHRPNSIITKWVLKVVPMLLTYKTDTYEAEYGDKVSSFSKVGVNEYVKFLQEKNILKTLKTGRYDVTGIIQDYPVVINEGPVDGSYRWLYQMNVMVTYMDAGIVTRNGNDNTITQELVVTTQIGRSRDASNEHGVVIETWDVKHKPKR